MAILLGLCLIPRGRGVTPLQEANRVEPLDGVAFVIDLLECGRKLTDFLGNERILG